jgi:hypothetical protein
VVQGEGRHRLHEADGLKALAGMLMSFGLFALGIRAAFAVDCPNTHKTVMACYDKTVKVSGADKPS